MGSSLRAGALFAPSADAVLNIGDRRKRAPAGPHPAPNVARKADVLRARSRPRGRAAQQLGSAQEVPRGSPPKKATVRKPPRSRYKKPSRGQRLNPSSVANGRGSMAQDWSRLVRRYRIRHGVTQMRLAAMLGVSQRTISRWERGEDGRVSSSSACCATGLGTDGARAAQPGGLSRSLSGSARAVAHPQPSPAGPVAARNRQAALRRRMDRPRPRAHCLRRAGRDAGRQALQRAIASRQIAFVLATTRSVLQTVEHARVGSYRTTISYFFHEGTLYSDAISVPVRAVLRSATQPSRWMRSRD